MNVPQLGIAVLLVAALVAVCELANRAVDRPRPHCRCGHAHDAHQHHRPGTDCALCWCRHYSDSVALARRIGRRLLGDDRTFFRAASTRKDAA